VFHYTYPELKGNPSKAALRGRINRLYGGAAGVSAGVAKKLKTRDLSGFLKTVPDVNVDLDIIPGEVVFEYSADIAMPRALNNQPYNVYLFLGQITTDPAHWMEDPNLVSYQASMGTLMGGQADLIIHGTIYLTQVILQKYAAGELPGLDQESVSDYLLKNLHWRTEEKGTAISADDAPAVEVHLTMQTVRAPESDTDFPNYLDTNKIAPINFTAPSLPL